MELREVVRNSEGSSSAKQRISSILKAPRKSNVLHDLEQQENEVENIKPSEKRNSRRVSFAPANDVLVFAKEAKNASPVRSLLQELPIPPAAHTQNRLQAAAAEDKNQQIRGIENLLNAPLHGSLHKDTISVDSWENVGDKTVMFSAEDAVMDMTHSHTMNIVCVEELLGESLVFDLRPANETGRKDSTPSIETASVTRQNIDSEASFFKPDGSKMENNDEAVIGSKICAWRDVLNKENQDPTSERETLVLKESFHKSPAAPESDVSMEITEVQDDLFHCLFPTFPDCAEKRAAPQTIPIPGAADMSEMSSTMKPQPSFHPRSNVSCGLEGVKMTVFAANDVQSFLVNQSKSHTEPSPGGDMSMDMTEVQTGHIEDLAGSQNPFHFLIPSQEIDFQIGRNQREDDELLEKENQRPGSSIHQGAEALSEPSSKTFLTHKDDSGERTVRFTADDFPMDITQSHTANIISDLPSEAAPKSLPSRSDARKQSQNHYQPSSFGCMVQKSMDTPPLGGEKTVRFVMDDAEMDVTKSHTVSIFTGVEPQDHRHATSPPLAGEKTMRFTLNNGGMDITKSHTVNIFADLDPKFCQNLDTVPCGEKTMRFTMSDAAMDMTKSHTVNISTDVKLIPKESVDALPAVGEKTMRFTSDGALMDFTKSHTVQITANAAALSKPMNYLPSTKDKTTRFTSKDAFMDMTKSHNANVFANPDPRLHQNLDSKPCGEQTLRLTMKDAAVDVTKRHTVNISADANLNLEENVDPHPTRAEKTLRFSSDDASMGIGESHTVQISANASFLSKPMDYSPSSRDRTIRFTSDCAFMDMTKSHTANVFANVDPKLHQNLDSKPCEERTLRLTMNDAAMDMTKSHTVNISGDANLNLKANVDLHSARAEKTLRFTSDDAPMDITRSHTVQISANAGALFTPMDCLTGSKDKTIRITAHDASLDVTKSQTVNISANFKPNIEKLSRIPPSAGENTLRFSSDDTMDVIRSHIVHIDAHGGVPPQIVAGVYTGSKEKTAGFSSNVTAMDITRSHTINIVADPHLGPDEKMDFIPLKKEKTLRFSSDAADVDVTRCHTVQIEARMDTPSDPDVGALPSSEEKAISTTLNCGVLDRTQSGSANILERSNLKPGQDVDSLSATNFTSADAPLDMVQRLTVNTDSHLPITKVIPGNVVDPFIETAAMTSPLASPQKHLRPQTTSCVPIDSLKVLTIPQKTPESNEFLSEQKHDSFPGVLENSPCKATQSRSRVDGTKGQSSVPVGESSTNNPSPGFSVTPNTKAAQENDETIKTSNVEPMASTSPSSGGAGNPPDSPDQDGASRKSRRKSLADLQSKLRRLSHMISAAPEVVDADPDTTPQPKTDEDEIKRPPNETVEEAKASLNAEVRAQEQSREKAEQSPAAAAAATPFSLKTKRLMSRLSVVGFKPKLPQRNNPEDTTKMTAAAGEPTRTVNLTAHLTDYQDDVSNIYDEELGSYEDMSETIDTRSPEGIMEGKGLLREEFAMELLESDGAREELFNFQGQKRPLAENEDIREDEKRLKASEEAPQHQDDVGESDMNSSKTQMSSHTSDASSFSHMASRCDAASDSTVKHSLFESQLEDYTSDAQKKLEDGSITVAEFFKLFNIDFVIHNPRQSVLPCRTSSEAEVTPMDLLKSKHISRPKQVVYEADVRSLSEKVERLKVRMWDLDKPLRDLNAALWEEMRLCSEKELKSFGAELKTRNNLFRKISKAQSHDMKGILYSQLIQVNQGEQQKLKGRIEEADEVIKRLDACIDDLEAELAEVEEKGSKDAPSLRTLQEEMKRVTDTLADTDRQTAELQIQRERSSSRIKRLQEESRLLQSHVHTLQLLNEWTLKERKDDGYTFTFLHDTMVLRLIQQKPQGSDLDAAAEQRVENISFTFHLDEETSHDHARLVHKLLTRFVDGESRWLEKYPTSGHLPKLLLDVSLVVSHCRLLGEELRLLRTWGGLRLSVLGLTCTDTSVCVTFSSLKAFSKFEVVFAVALRGHLYELKAEAFRNMIGSTTIQQVEDIVASVSPGRNLLTKVVGRIHSTLLC